MRIAKYLSEAGVASRRKSEILISSGRIAVNGHILDSPAFNVTENDQVTLDGHPVHPAPKKTYIMLNKPVGVTCTAEDRHASRIIYDLLPRAFHSLRYAGRLDRDTEGLLILTDDGELIQTLTHPSHQVQKLYRAVCHGVFSSASARCMLQGIMDQGEFLQARKVELKPDDTASGMVCLEITMTEGKKREVRRLCAAVGLPVQRLKRIMQGKLPLGKLPCGQWRYLTEEEVALLQ